MFNHFIILINIIFNDSYLFFLYIILAFIISCLLIILSYVLAFQKYDNEKLSGYECALIHLEMLEIHSILDFIY